MSREHRSLSVEQRHRLAVRLRRLRFDRQWTQAQLAAASGIHENDVYKHERGLSAPELVTLLRYSETYAEPVCSLLGHPCSMQKVRRILAQAVHQSRELLKT